jgi:hypothetical protein
MKIRLVFLSLVAVALVVGSLFQDSSVSAQGKPRQRTALVVLGPTGNEAASGQAFITISDQNQNPANIRLVIRMEVSGMPTGRFATHIHEGFCPPPIGPEPDQQGPIVLDTIDTNGFNLDSQVRIPLSVTSLRPSNLPTRMNGIRDFNELLDTKRNFYLNVHQRSSDAPNGIGPGLLCGRVEFR